MANLTLYQLTDEMQAIEALLEENGGELTDALLAAFNDNVTSIARKVDGYGTLIRKFAATSDNCKQEIARMQSIKSTCDKSAKRLKDHLAEVMDVHGVKTLEGDTTKVALIKTKATEVDADAVLAPYAALIEALQSKLPDFIEVKATVSKTKLKEAFEGTDVAPEGVQFVENKSVRIR